MKVIEIELSEFTQRSRSLSVAHRSTDLPRGLEYGERILVRTAGTYRTAVVVDVDFSSRDTHYRLVLGARVANETARSRLPVEADVPDPARQLSVDDVADLLARSGSSHRIPGQRQAAHRLLDR